MLRRRHADLRLPIGCVDARNGDNLRHLNKYVVEGARAVELNKRRGTVNYKARPSPAR